MAGTERDPLNPGQDKTPGECIAGEASDSERFDEHGNRWRKVYVGGGAHFQNWVEQFRELGEVMVEEVDPKGFRCFEESGETLYRVWMKVEEERWDDLY
jgi:hypothetical protein